MQAISINHPQVKASLEQTYLTTREAATVLGCSTRKILMYSQPPINVLRRIGEGKVLVNAFDVYNAIDPEKGKDRLKHLARQLIAI